VNGPAHVSVWPAIVGLLVVAPVVEPFVYVKPAGSSSEIESSVTGLPLGLLTVIVYPSFPPAGVVEASAVLEVESTVAPGWHAPAAVVPSTSRSRKTAESRMRSPWSKIER